MRPAQTRRPQATMSQHGAPDVETAHLVNGQESPLNLVSLVKSTASAQLLEASCSLSAACPGGRRLCSHRSRWLGVSNTEGQCLWALLGVSNPEGQHLQALVGMSTVLRSYKTLVSNHANDTDLRRHRQANEGARCVSNLALGCSSTVTMTVAMGTGDRRSESLFRRD